jgi:cell wall-associated NlpC family hydrolase
MLCDDGGAQSDGLASAIFAYNHSSAYVTEVLSAAGSYGSSIAAPTGIDAFVISAAESYVGTPYVWGGEDPGVGFDCSGLVQWVFAEAGVDLPRVAQNQYDATVHLPPGSTLEPGDLVFFGPSTEAIEHVGIYIGNGDMVDAPHTGAFVRIEPMPMFTPAFVAASLPELAGPPTG